MAEEPSLPRLPGVSWDERSQSFSNNPKKRIRPRGRSFRYASSISHNSSDPAVFSSDDDPGLDNYNDPPSRRKRRYVGSWYHATPALLSSDSALGSESNPPNDGTVAKPKGKRTLERQMDSGVFLGSDGTDGEDWMPGLPVRSKLPQLDQRPGQAISRRELLARDKIRSCIDRGNEVIDLYDLGLEELGNESVEVLSMFMCIPVVVAPDVEFVHKDPELQMYLGKNLLTRLPGALFNVEAITTLSLRGNQLTELPPAIAKLRSLTELNVSQNQLRSLPVELLELMEARGCLKTLVVHPNPFWQPERLPSNLHSLATMEGKKVRSTATQGMSVWRTRPRHLSCHVAMTPLQESNSLGIIMSSFKFPANSSTCLPLGSQDGSHGDNSQYTRVSAVPSLFEAALRKCAELDELPDLPDYIPEGLPQIRNVLNRALAQKEEGGIRCSSCRRHIVVPAMEWIEWRQLTKVVHPAHAVHPRNDDEIGGGEYYLHLFSEGDGETALPFLHRACSGACGPKVEVPLQWRTREGWEVSFDETK